VRVPLLSPPTGTATTRATIFVWLAERPGDELAVGLERDGVSIVDLVRKGETRVRTDGTLTVTVLNRAGEVAGTPVGEQGTVVVVDGSWPSGTVFALRLEGHGTASLWAQSEGELGPAGSTIGAVFARASSQGTITVPATHPSLFAVGATLNRNSWIDHAGEAVEVVHYGALDSVAYFSSAGPTQTGGIKPDLVAPGAFVIGAMASEADPAAHGGAGVFGQSSVCDPNSYCLVVDTHYAALAGTSVAAPLVSGAMALLLAKDSALTQDRLRTLLQAGARRPAGTAPVEQQAGPGALDLTGTLAVLARQQTGGGEVLPAPAESWVTLADEFAHPDPDWPLLGTLSLRSASGEIADGFDPGRLTVRSSVGTVTPALTREAPGFWRFGLGCPRGSGGQTLEVAVLFDGQALFRRSIPIAVDRAVAQGGFSARGGCATSGRGTRSAPVVLGCLVLGFFARRRRRRQWRLSAWVMGTLVLGCRPASPPPVAAAPPNTVTALTPPPRAARAPASGSTNHAAPPAPGATEPRPPTPHPEPGAPAEPPAGTDEAALLVAGQKVQDCFEQAYSGKVVPAGELRLTVLVELAPSGQVSAVRIDEQRTSRGLLGGEFERCSLAALGGRRFAAQAGERTLELPFTLQPLGGR
jgi:hypothetical protein